jgi:signal peptidase I
MNINFDFPLLLTLLVLVSGILVLLDKIYLAKRRKSAKKGMPWYMEYARSFFPILLIVLLIRSFIVQPYRVPTGSLEPTVLPGDFIIVNQFVYGLRLPVFNTKILAIQEPQSGDIALFRPPKNSHLIFVKRVIGIPGDHIVYRNKILTINGKVVEQEPRGLDLDIEKDFSLPVERRLEILPNGVKHEIFIEPEINRDEKVDVVVPAGHYFMMGDNRDASDDSRDFGFVPEKNLIGKAFGIWMSWDGKQNTIRWQRIGKGLR